MIGQVIKQVDKNEVEQVTEQVDDEMIEQVSKQKIREEEIRKAQLELNIELSYLKIRENY